MSREVIEIDQEPVNQEGPEDVAKRTEVNVEKLTQFKKEVKAVGDFVFAKNEDERFHCKRCFSKRCPYFLILISIVEVIVYIYYGATYGEWLSYSPELSSSPLAFDPRKREEVWRFLTYMFVHAGLVHIFSNVFNQLIIGHELEVIHGSLIVALIYLAGVLGGSLASSTFDPYHVLVGASGGVYALFTAELAEAIVSDDVMNKRFDLCEAKFFSLLLCAEFGYFIYRASTTSSAVKVSVFCHVGGAIVGMTIGLIYFRNFKKPLRHKIAFWTAVAVCIGFMLVFILRNIF